MQGNPPWFTPPSSALNSETTNANYFYNNYNQQWNRPPSSGYDSQYYQGQSNYSTNNTMRACGENFGSSPPSGYPNNYECPPVFFRQGTGDPSGPCSTPARNRNERTRPSADASHFENKLPNFDNKSRNQKSMNGVPLKPNENEDENFSSVFTQSLTSLYSHDADPNFTDDKNGDDPEIVGSCVRPKAEDAPSLNNGSNNASTSEYSFSSVYDSGGNASVNYDNVKVKTEPYTSPENSQYENFAMDDMFLRRRGTLAEAYSRKRKHSMPAMYGSAAMNGVDEKRGRVFHPDSQWIPNSLPNCPAGDELSKCTYQQNDYATNFDRSRFHGSRFKKRRVMKSRISVHKGEPKESKSQSSCKKVQKKLSPMTVYVKILDDVIMDVTCRRYKKRTKPADEIQGNSQSAESAHESLENIFEIVGKVLFNVVDRVSKTVPLPPKPLMDLSKIPPAKGSELLFKFCHDYCLDYRDFTDFYEIIETDVTNIPEDDDEDEVNEVIENRRNRRVRGALAHRGEQPSEESRRGEQRCRKRRTATNDESVCRRSERVSEKEPKDTKVEKQVLAKSEPPVEIFKSSPRTSSKSNIKITKRTADTEPETPVRVLRSLPSRKPQKGAKKPKAPPPDAPKIRYPKRNLRTTKNPSVNLGKKLKIVIDLSKENDQPEILVESDSSNTKSNIDNAKEHESENASSLPESNGDSTTKESTGSENCAVQNNSDNEESNSDSDDQSKEILSRSRVPSPVIVLEAVDMSKVKEGYDTVKKDEDVSLRQPPQLVRMTDNSNLFLEENQDKENTVSKGDTSTTDCLSSRYLESRISSHHVADNVPPPTLRRNESFSRSPSRETPYGDEHVSETDEDDESNKLIIDTTAKESGENEDSATPITASKRSSSYEEDNQKSSLPKNNYEEFRELRDASKRVENPEDECVLVYSDTERPKTLNDQTAVCSTDEKSSVSTSSQEILVEGKPCLERIEDTLSEDEKAMSSGSKSSPKDEQDESILRTLLLESEVASCSGFPKEFESSEASLPIIPKVTNLSSRENMSALNIDAMRSIDFPSNHVPSFPNDQPFEMCEPLRIPKYQSYHDAYVSSLSPETYEAAQRQFRDHPPSMLPQMPKCETKDTVIKDPQQLKEKIKKLKNEIVYLQLMAEQKEKEKIAIVCFKRYKEEILKRIYKAYAFSVQDHVRDWIFAKRENAAESRASASTATSTVTSSPNHRGDSIRACDQSKNASEALREESVYPTPAPAHSSSHRAHTFQNPQSLVKPRNNQTTNEKVSAVETMVAKASENYGLDMTNLRERLRGSPEASTSGTILQKVLSSKNTARNSPPEPVVATSWSPDLSKRNSAPTKPVAPIPSKPYPDQFSKLPLDMMMPQTSRMSPSTEIRNSKVPDHCRSNVETPKPSHINSERTPQPIQPEPLQLKSQRNPYRSWSIQTGGRISEDRPVFSKPSPIPSSSSHTVPSGSIDVESPLKKQLSSHKVVPRPTYGLPSVGIKPTNYESKHSGYEPSRHRSDAQELSERSSVVSGECNKKSDEDRGQMNYASSVAALSSSSTMPYGGHIIPNTSPIPSTSTITKVPTPTTSSTPLCMGCGVSDAKFLCSGCRKHWYCSAQCQSLRWPEHSRVCAGRMFQQNANNYS